MEEAALRLTGRRGKAPTIFYKKPARFNPGYNCILPRLIYFLGIWVFISISILSGKRRSEKSWRNQEENRKK
jgi:hypothetical protein